MEKIKTIINFDGEFAFLSNFYPSPIWYEGVLYPTNEHLFQAMKTLDQTERLIIANAPTPGKAKRLGRHVKLRSDWEEIKVDAMCEGLMLKFTDKDLAEKLVSTGDAWLCEGNTWHDNTWGICLCERCGGSGKNLLGHLLMDLRDKLKEEL